ncbi:hypothetical protein AB0N14_09900, partial [Streptomyces sp. NPDC051104]
GDADEPSSASHHPGHADEPSSAPHHPGDADEPRPPRTSSTAAADLRSGAYPGRCRTCRTARFRSTAAGTARGMGSLSSPGLLLLFAASAAVIWYAGVKLSDTTDVLAERLHLGSALGGLILLAIATNLPETAITVSAAMAGQLDVAVGNILGGIAVQTVVLAVLDATGVRPCAPLTRLAASLQLVLEGALVVAVPAVVVMGTQLPPELHAAGLAPASVAIAALWVIGLVLLNRAGRGLPWREGGDAPDSQPEPRGHSRAKKEKAAGDRGVSTARATLVFSVSALATLVAGVVIERSGEEFFALRAAGTERRAVRRHRAGRGHRPA